MSNEKIIIIDGEFHAKNSTIFVILIKNWTQQISTFEQDGMDFFEAASWVVSTMFQVID